MGSRSVRRLRPAVCTSSARVERLRVSTRAGSSSSVNASFRGRLRNHAGFISLVSVAGLLAGGYTWKVAAQGASTPQALLGQQEPKDLDLTVNQYSGAAGDLTAPTKSTDPSTPRFYDDAEPSFSPDRLSVYYTSNRLLPGSPGYNLWKMQLDGSFQQPVQGAVGKDQEWPAVSRDGSSLAYSSRGGDGVAQIHILRLATATDFQITTGAGDKLHPTWGVGNTIAFQDNEITPDNPTGLFKIWVAQAQLSSTPSVRFQLTGTGAWDLASAGMQDTQPAWEPSGAHIAFARFDGKTHRIWLITNVQISPGVGSVGGSVSASPPGQLTDFQDPNSGALSDDQNPTWRPNGLDFDDASSNPDGSVLAFASTRKSPQDVTVALSSGATSVGSTYGIYRTAISYTSQGQEVFQPESKAPLRAVVVAEDTQHPGFSYNDITPSWSQDERVDTVTGVPHPANHIVYSSNSGVPYGVTTPNTNSDIWSSQVYDFTPPTPIGVPTVTPRVVLAGQPVTISVRLADLYTGVGSVFVQIKNPNSHLQDTRLPALRNSLPLSPAATTSNDYYLPYLPIHGLVDPTIPAGQVGPFGVVGPLDQPVVFDGHRIYQISYLDHEAQVSSSTGATTGATTGTTVTGTTTGATRQATTGTTTGTTTTTGVVTTTSFQTDFWYHTYDEVGYQPINPVTYSYADGGNENLPFDLQTIITHGVATGMINPNAPPPDCLQLTQSPTDPTLFTGQWVTDPNIDTDYIVDVIAVDRASNGVNGARNAMDYDNITGFSTKTFRPGANSILLVADYVTPQQFIQPRGGELQGMEFGVESWLTDNPLAKSGIQRNSEQILVTQPTPPSATSTSTTTGTTTGTTGSTSGLPPIPLTTPPIDTEINVQPFTPANNVDRLNEVVPVVDPNAPVPIESNFLWGFTNTLGSGSWVDVGESRSGSSTFLPSLPDPSQSVFTPFGQGPATYNGLAGWPANEDNFDPRANLDSYDIWRILCRGPIPQDVLNTYGPVTVPAPSASNLNQTISVQTHPRCVVWASPFTADELVGPGTILDANTQNEIAQFLNSGGHICLTGQDVAWALALGQPTSTVPSHDFLRQYFGVQFNSDRLFPLGDDILNQNGPIGNRWAATMLGNGGPDGPLKLLAHYLTDDESVAMTEYKHLPDLIAYAAHTQDFPDTITSLGTTVGATTGGATTGGATTGGATTGAATGGTTGGAATTGTATTGTATTGAATTSTSTTGVIPPPQIFTDYQQTAGGVDLVSTINPKTGAKTVFSSFGLEGVNDGVTNLSWTHLAPDPRTAGATVTQKVVQLGSQNQRALLMHGIVDWLRENTATGQVNELDAAGNLQPFPNALITGELDDGSKTVIGTALSQADGSFTLPALPTGLGFGGLLMRPAVTAIGFAAGLTLPQQVLRTEGSTGVKVVATRPGFSQVHEPPIVVGHAGLPSVLESALQQSTGPVRLLLSVAPNGTLEGSVTDATTGVDIVGATVTVTNIPFTDITQTVTTTGPQMDAQGRPFNYTMSLPATAPVQDNLTTSSYSVSVSANGYRPVTQSLTNGANPGPILVPSGATAVEDVQLLSTSAPLPSTPAPTNLQAKTISQTEIDLTWVGNSVNPQATTYKILRQPAGGVFTQVGTTGATSFQDMSASIATNYSYEVIATTNGLDSVPSAPVSASTNGGVIAGTISIRGSTSNNAVPGISVTLAQPAGGFTPITVVTDASGHYGYAGLADGAYTVTVSAPGQTQPLTANVTIAKANAVTQNLILQPPFIFNAGISLVSVPYSYSNLTITAPAVFGISTAVDGSAAIASYDPATNSYQIYPNLPGGNRQQTQPGVGYWITESAQQPFAVPGFTVSSPFTRALSTGWNLIGDPFLTSVPLNSLQVTVGNGAAMGFQAASTAGIVSGTVYSYSPTQNLYQVATSIDPFMGYWLYVFPPQGSASGTVSLTFTQAGS